MKVYLFQNDKEPYFWTKNYVDDLENIDPQFFLKNDTFDVDNISFKLIKNQPYDTSVKFYDDGLNILVLNYQRSFTLFKSVFDLHKDKKFLFIIKTIEDYAHVRENEQEQFIEYISKSSNIKVLWDISEAKHTNFYFVPKLHIQNYYNNNNFFPSDLFLHGHNIYKNITNKKRLGAHFNKGYLVFRKKLIDGLSKIESENLFLTVNKNSRYNTNIDCNYKSEIYDNNLDDSQFPYQNYIDSFLNLNIKSEIELVYETFTITSNHNNLIKLNEKTIKHLYLGKPFIHSDPIAHSLLLKNNVKPYNSLYTNQLLDLYNNLEMSDFKNQKEFYWYDTLLKNINWVVDMDSNEWENRYQVALNVGEENRKRVYDMIFNESLIDFVKQYDSL